MAQYIKTNLEVQEVRPKNGTDFQWEELRDFVGGYIEIVHLNEKQLMVVNEEGKIYGLEYNPIASEAFHLCKGFYEEIVGNVLICDVEQIK